MSTICAILPIGTVCRAPINRKYTPHTFAIQNYQFEHLGIVPVVGSFLVFDPSPGISQHCFG
ncbi:MAG TPA: hypothetical protein DDY14_15290 [Chromatiaceae bacterium]|nr:hypothetical protein [Chromatiaceae bacterium]HCS92441.1 hypothetical protein [Chromatiaceae bacterium]